MKEILEAYKGLAEKHDLPEMQAGNFEMECERISEPNEVWNAVARRNPLEGWLLFQSHQTGFRGGLPPHEEDWGQLLACEAVTDDGRSLFLEQDGAGGWRLLLFTHAQAGDDILFDEPEFLAYDPQWGVLRYRRYWRYFPEQGYVQEAACFIGFGD